MAIVEISNLPKSIAVALDWHLLPGTTSERREVDSLARRTGSKFGCVLTDDDNGLTIVGLSTDKKEGVNCGAAWLARASAGESVLLVEPLENGRIWLCAVRAGLPVQGMDIVIEVTQLHERLREFLSDGADAKLCSTLENLDQAYPNVVPQSFAELVSNTKPERVRRIAGINPVLATASALVVVLIAGYYGGGYYFTQQRQKAAQAKLLEIGDMQRQRDAERVAAAKQERVEAAQNMIRQVVLDMPAVSEIVAAYLGELSNKPLVAAGWVLSNYDCSRLACTLTWQRQEAGTIVSFLKTAELNGWMVSSIEGSDATTSHAVTAATRTNSLDELGETAPFRAAIESRLQQAGSHGLRYELSKAEPLAKMMTGAVQAASPGALPPETGEALPYWVGTLTVKGSSLFELRELPDYISHPGVSVKNVRGDLKANQWTMELNYATR